MRGLATNLHRLGVSNKVIQLILRHANVAVTQASYIKTVDADATAAMKRLEMSMVATLPKNNLSAKPNRRHEPKRCFGRLPLVVCWVVTAAVIGVQDKIFHRVGDAIIRIHKRIVAVLKNYAECLAIILIITARAWSQMSSGTLIVVYLSDDKAAIAGDSRATVKECTGIVREDDSQCKIIALDDKTVFSAFNYARHIAHGSSDPAGEYSAIEVAKHVYKESPTDVANVAAEWAKRIAEYMENTKRIHPDTFSGLVPGVAVGGIFLTSTSHDEIRAYEGKVNFAPNEIPHFHAHSGRLRCQTKIGPYCAFGHIEIFNEFSLLTSDRARSEAAECEQHRAFRKWAPDDEVLRAIRLVDLTINYGLNHDVGGAIDAAIIRRGGRVQWIARKQQCPAN
jgi:hypothetical protein